MSGHPQTGRTSTGEALGPPEVGGPCSVREVSEQAGLPRRVPRTTRQRHAPTGADLIAVPDSMARLAQAQHGVLTRAQLARAGLGRGQVDAAISARRWQRHGRRVVVLHNGALSQRQREWVAVLLPGKLAGLAGLSGAAAGGLRGFEPERVHVVVAHGTEVTAPGWVKLHESRRLLAADVRTDLDPPRTRLSRSVVDAAVWSASPRRACAILCACVQQRLATPTQLQHELGKAGRVRHAGVLRAILGDISGGGHTLAEIDLGPLARRAGLPAPRRQALRREAGDRVRYLDAEFDLPDGTRLAVEIDGAVHLTPETWWDDQDRQNELLIGGLPTLRYASLTLRLCPELVVSQLRRIRLRHTPR